MKPLLWLAVALAALAAGWLLLAPAPQSDGWRISAESAYVVGDSLDPFVYAGGDAIRRVSGSATIRLAEVGGDGTVRLSIEAPEGAAPLTLRDGSVVGRSWDLVSSVDASTELWVETSIHGNTEIGEQRLPETIARLAGAGSFELTVDRARRLAGLSGFWSIADAVRREDGSIRQQGLVFSPLLRDKTGFSDPERVELTLLLYEEGPGSNVLVHLLFTNVVVGQPPTAADAG
jgi:hypothetical protein